jgi:methionyl-tRNA formyltransferase
VRLVFAGTPAVALPALRALLDSDRHEIVAVVTRPAARTGRGRHTAVSPVESAARQAGLPVLTPTRLRDETFLAELAALAPDCCPVVAFGALVPASALAVPREGWVNLHYSLLPAWRGAAPVQHAILAGDEITGATSFRLEEGLDTGPVFGVVTEPIRPDDTAGDLLTRLAGSGAQLLVATMDGIADGSLQPRPQPAEGVSFAGKITVTDARVPWSEPALHVDRLIRACTPAPGAWSMFRDERLKLGPVRIGTGSLAVGQVRVAREAVDVGTATVPVSLGTVQPPGRRSMPAADWARGARLEAGDRLA